MAETKPFHIQSPEQIAKDYGGNKQKIAEAMQLGILDPTAGTLAGMFIDRMRQAAQAEQVPQQTVAQQVFAPQQAQAPQMAQAPGAGMAPAGLGATPEAAAMAGPQAAAMGAPQAPMGAPPMGMPQGGAPAMPGLPGMASGGMVGPYSGGVSDLPVPDTMFDEPSNGGYARGGIVAFAGGTNKKGIGVDKVDATDISSYMPDIEVNAQTGVEEDALPFLYQAKDVAVPNSIYGFESTPEDNLDTVNKMSPRETQDAMRYREYMNKMLDPHYQKARRKEDMWAALGQLGATMATTPGSLLQAAGKGMQAALPQIAAANKARRAEEQAVYQTLVSEERTKNKELQDRMAIALDMSKNYASEADAMKTQTFKDLLTRLGFDYDYAIAKMTGGMNLRGALANAYANIHGSDQQLRGEILRGNQYARQKADADTAENGPFHADYLKRGDAAWMDRYRFYGGMDDDGWSASRR